jgi:sugar (pentulose or hexulose) kinase
MITNYYLGLDFGTSGARAIAIDNQGEIQASIAVGFDAPRDRRDWFEIWSAALAELLTRLDRDVRRQLRSIAIDGTSATVFLCDRDGQPWGEPLMYNDDRARCVLDRVAAIAPDHHPTRSATSSLAKLIWLLEVGELNAISSHENSPRSAYTFCHQADWLAFQLHGVLGISDYNNALKFGYDPAIEQYPNWLRSGLRMIAPRYAIHDRSPLRQSHASQRKSPRAPSGVVGVAFAKQIVRPFARNDDLGSQASIILPHIVAPGTPIATITPAIADRFALPATCTVIAGTTDSIAAFLASGTFQPGEAVTSLGSTLAVKLLSRSRVDDARYGIYSHRLGDLWLAGGASNTGGAVLRHFFSDRELTDLSQNLPNAPSPLNYYPLLKPGERFPVNDPELAPRLEPRPNDRAEFLHGLLDAIARIEAQGYALLKELGAEPLSRVLTTGGGAKNVAWERLRSRRLGLLVERAAQSEAAYGVACLARSGVYQKNWV